MNRILLPLLGIPLLFAGCETTLVETRPAHHGYGYSERDDHYRGDYHRSYDRPHSDSYYPSPGYRGTAGTYHNRTRAPYYDHSRPVPQTEVVVVQPNRHRATAPFVTVEKKKSHKKKDKHDH